MGAYHFFRKNRSGQEQADNFLDVIKGRTLDLPLVIDLEDDWGNGATTSHDTAVKRLLDMIAVLKGKGYQVMIYTNNDGYDKYYKDLLGDCDLWLCSFTSPDRLNMPHLIQQYSHEGEVDGVEGEVDLNVFRGTVSEWERYLQRVAFCCCSSCCCRRGPLPRRRSTPGAGMTSRSRRPTTVSSPT